MTSTLQVQPSESLVGPLRDKEGFFKVQPSKNDLLLAEPAPTLEGCTCIAGTYRRWEAFRDVGGQRERVLVRSVSRAGRVGQPSTFDYLVVGSTQLFRGVICRLRVRKSTCRHFSDRATAYNGRIATRLHISKTMVMVAVHAETNTHQPEEQLAKFSLEPHAALLSSIWTIF
ncbi:hypothetical protein CGCSCA5_v007097 [Colletotrichum siamense]|nr:hypothetical protein CGCSCA5_v007097 [Colletotrichum siamense]